MRQIVLDTETTGLSPRNGDRVIEVGCVEIVNRALTGRNFHAYINPERDSDEAALAVHGLTTEFLRDKPKFAEIAADLRAFVDGAELIIHNAPFDLGFLNHEFKLLGWPEFSSHASNVIDTYLSAKELHPGKRNSLDALCERYGISNAHRTLHGALLDSELLAEVYLAMTRGQHSLGMDLEVAESDAGDALAQVALGEVLVLAASAEEVALHASVLDGIDKGVKGPCVWRQLEPAGQSQ